jgi:predicted kinase
MAWIAALEQYIDQNTRAFTEHSRLFDTQAVKELDERSRAALDRLRPLLERRIKLNLVRRGHGDLHLGNLALVDGEPVAFDAIEFDPVIASGDVLYDLAFLLMDLVERDLVSLSNLVLNEYFTAVRRDADLEGIAALPFFMSLRAAIRANVTAARLERSGAQDRAAAEASAQRYFLLACELLQPRQPAIICTAGLSGTGKSVLARSLAPFMPPLPGALILRSDVERKAMTGLPETEQLPPEAYSIDASAKLYALLYEKAGRIGRAGHSVIVDAVFARKRERAEIEAAARKAGAHFLGLFLTAPLDIRLQRVAWRHGDVSDADAAVARQQEAYQLGTMNWTLLDASGSPAETLAKALELLPDAIKAPARPLPAERRNEDPQAPGWHPPAHTPSSR